MRQDEHRSMDQPADEVQSKNREWWSSNPMTYDWGGTVDLEPMTRPWFEEVDRRFIAASRPFLTDDTAFDRIMPDDLSGRRVLEIGCGMGLHTSELVRRGGEVTSVDLTDFAVQATRTRLDVFGLDATVQQADAEHLPFDDDAFDFVWSWGVIHHSACTTRIVRQIARVLAPDGETRVMVYNRESFLARYVLLRHFVLGLEFRDRTSDEVLWDHTDGFTARYYHLEQFDDLFRGFFDHVSTTVLGQESDAIPLPARFRAPVATRISNRRKQAMAAKRGGFLFTVASAPS